MGILEEVELVVPEKEMFLQVEIHHMLHLKILLYLLQQTEIIDMMEQLFIDQLNKMIMLLKMYMMS